MCAMAFKITSLTIVYTTVYLGVDQRKKSKLRGEFPAQRASNAENVSIWWRHHGFVRLFILFRLRNLFFIIQYVYTHGWFQERLF